MPAALCGACHSRRNGSLTLTKNPVAAFEDLRLLLLAKRAELLDDRRVQEIDAALDRMNTDDFGVCADCGEAISAITGSSATGSMRSSRMARSRRRARSRRLARAETRRSR